MYIPLARAHDVQPIHLHYYNASVVSRKKWRVQKSIARYACARACINFQGKQSRGSRIEKLETHVEARILQARSEFHQDIFKYLNSYPFRPSQQEVSVNKQDIL